MLTTLNVEYLLKLISIELAQSSSKFRKLSWVWSDSNDLQAVTLFVSLLGVSNLLKLLSIGLAQNILSLVL